MSTYFTYSSTFNSINTLKRTTELKKKISITKNLKLASLAGSIVGTFISGGLILCKNGNSKNFFQKVVSTDFSSTKNMFFIAISSILGGFMGGAIKDKGKDNFKKIREANFQILSNVAFPLLFLNILKHANTKITKNANKTVKNIGNFVSVFGGVAIGAFTGSAIANKTNNLFSKEKEYKRNLGIKDFLIHIDDLPVALAFAGIPYIDKLIPFILISRGYDVGK